MHAVFIDHAPSKLTLSDLEELKVRLGEWYTVELKYGSVLGKLALILKVSDKI